MMLRSCSGTSAGTPPASMRMIGAGALCVNFGDTGPLQTAVLAVDRSMRRRYATRDFGHLAS